MAATPRKTNDQSAVKVENNDQAKVETAVESAILDLPTLDLTVGEARVLSALVAAEYKTKRAGMADAKRDVTGRTSALMLLVSLKAKLDQFVAQGSDDQANTELPDSI